MRRGDLAGRADVIRQRAETNNQADIGFDSESSIPGGLTAQH